MDDRLKGRAKEAAGAVRGDEETKAEGRADQRKGEAEKDAKRAQTESEARAAERERDRKDREGKGLLGGSGIL